MNTTACGRTWVHLRLVSSFGFHQGWFNIYRTVLLLAPKLLIVEIYIYIFIIFMFLSIYHIIHVLK